VDSAISRRYAKALFDLATQDQLLDQTQTGLEELTEALTRHPDLSNVCLNPMFSREEHWKVMEKILDRLSCSTLIVRFVNLLVIKHRLVYLPEITRLFAELVDEIQGREAVRVQSPREMSDEDRANLKAKLEETLGREVVLSVQHRPDLIAGIALQVKSQVFDGSVRGKLDELRRTLSIGG
jgi:F-type H+-transporting ATPase subunit delta